MVDVQAHVTRGSAAELGQPMGVTVLVDGAEETIQAPRVLLGYELARTLGVRVGDWVNVMSPMGSASALGLIPRIKRFAVGGQAGLGATGAERVRPGDGRGL